MVGSLSPTWCWTLLRSSRLHLAWLDWTVLYWVGLNWAHIVWARLGSGGIKSAEATSVGLVWNQLG